MLSLTYVLGDGPHLHDRGSRVRGTARAAGARPFFQQPVDASLPSRLLFVVARAARCSGYFEHQDARPRSRRGSRRLSGSAEIAEAFIGTGDDGGAVGARRGTACVAAADGRGTRQSSARPATSVARRPWHSSRMAIGMGAPLLLVGTSRAARFLPHAGRDGWTTVKTVVRRAFPGRCGLDARTGVAGLAHAGPVGAPRDRRRLLFRRFWPRRHGI